MDSSSATDRFDVSRQSFTALEAFSSASDLIRRFSNFSPAFRTASSSFVGGAPVVAAGCQSSPSAFNLSISRNAPSQRFFAALPRLGLFLSLRAWRMLLLRAARHSIKQSEERIRATTEPAIQPSMSFRSEPATDFTLASSCEHAASISDMGVAEERVFSRQAAMTESSERSTKALILTSDAFCVIFMYSSTDKRRSRASRTEI
mmetsp:Transcript_1525/g.3311  ORF Transcript_1525/g.3311 Transcript_1525/m.3311 type:complete len:204 (+) Transcript_1525:1192-1803(+)